MNAHFLRRLCAALLVVAIGFAAVIARADGGPAVLVRADAAWDQGDYDVASALYSEALEHGGLTPEGTLECYVRRGAALVVLGREKDALSALRFAALLNPNFILPPEAGRKASRIASQARREEQRGPIRISAVVPDNVAANQPFHVDASMDAHQVVLISKLHVFVRDAAVNKIFDKSDLPSTNETFDIPATMAIAGHTLVVRVDALDGHDNRLVSFEKKVTVAGAAPVPIAADAGAPPAAADAGASTSTSADSDDEGDDDDKGSGKTGGSEDGQGPWSIPHGSKKYTAVRTDKPPTIDGDLSDPIWATAPKDNRFLSTRSKPYGQATTEPTVVQVAYDDENLYVAFRCTYSKAGARDDSFAGDEQTVIEESESVSVLVDAVHGHTGAYEFVVSPVGAFADAELSDQGSVENLDWRGAWDVETVHAANGWTAEFRIPWGTMRMPSHTEPFDVGINFGRREPTSGEYALWALHPPATEIFDTNFFGHLDGLSNVFPGQRLYLEPYIAFAFDRTSPAQQSSLTDFTGTNRNFRAYAGAYVRFRPPGPFRADATFNPDFSTVNADQALANFDRFELEFPENRPFFAEDTPRFQFGAPRYLYGDLGGQLFYSRTIGINTNLAGLTQPVPILWGVKSVLREGGTEAALMNVETSPNVKTISLSDNATIGRVTETYEGQRIGGIFLNRAGDSGGYTAGGADALVSLYDRHLQFSGFYAASQSAGSNITGAGEGTVAWKSQDFYMQSTYMEIGRSFDAPLGYFPITGARAEMFAAGYSPVVRNDLVQQVFLDGQLSLVTDRDSNQRIYDRGVVAASISTIQNAVVQASVQPAIENVTTAFPIGNGTITVQPGKYTVMVTQVNVTTAPRRLVVFGVGYTGGDLYDGKRDSPSVSLGLNLGRFAAKATYQLFILSYNNEQFNGHELDASASFAYTPKAKTSLLVGMNTIAERANAQLVTSIQFGLLSTLSFALRGTSGSTIDVLASDWTDNPDFSAILSLAIGVSPF
jgi:hypothetical protein